ncbi:maleylpyruvate isomerase family mycothiol-dependent enzyme [Saccharothrix deserti]|uniref:maleylpyruvate isomerase family mycothiol-dependent enzyme n=1 Tax=Saccharothrix deserti TaxID=2593674 RepID=UPI00131C9ABB|nr:maleylpyruvate isomerase family mycothiol-dependent enzyme [Saccharothrix deserti]
MTGRHDFEATLPWMREGTGTLLAVVDELTDDDLRAPSRLPGWTRAHVVGHLARNAEALTRLATWARTGVESPMYAGRDQRALEIEQSAGLPADVLRSEVAGTAVTLDKALGELTGEQWNAEVRSALGRAIPAAEVPWMRIREVWLHAVDLDAGVTADDLPAGVVDLLIDDVAAALTAKEGCPSVDLAPTDRARRWHLGPAGAGTTGAATAADIAGWLTGRLAGGVAESGGRPPLPRWL